MHLRSLLSSLLLAAAAVLPGPGAWGMAQKPRITVRFHTETSGAEGGSFASPVKLQYQHRDTFIKKVPEFSERNIRAIFPFENSDKSWGCAFLLDEQGRLRLETMSSEAQGSALVVFVGTKSGTHQVVDMLIDRPVTDGVITVPRGLTELEVKVLRGQFPIMGTSKGGQKKQPEPKKDDRFDPEWSTPARRPQHPAARLPDGPPPAPAPAPAARPARREGGPDLPHEAN